MAESKLNNLQSYQHGDPDANDDVSLNKIISVAKETYLFTYMTPYGQAAIGYHALFSGKRVKQTHKCTL
jgi:hypothetical protein